MSLLFASITHLGCFILILIDLPLLPWLTPLIFWRIFFGVYCGIAVGVVALAVNQLRNFLSHVNEIVAKEHEMEGYETVQHSVEYYDTGESGETYDKEYEFQSKSWKHTDSGF